MPDILQCQTDFSVLKQQPYGHKLIYLDNAASCQLPQCVLDSMNEYYQTAHANVHRGAHYLSQRATDKYEQARLAVQSFINAKAPNEIVFTAGTTAAINIVANGLEPLISAGDEIVVSQLEHHANFIPWQQLCQRTGAGLRIIPAINGELDLNALDNLLGAKTKIVALTHVSNLTGTLNPLKDIIAKTHACGALVLIDGAQGLRHGMVDVQALDCDFYCFSGHKLCAPTGIGVLYGKLIQLEKLRPNMWGGGMVEQVATAFTTPSPLPYRLEAGTPNICGAVGLHAALAYLENIGREAIGLYELELLDYTERLLRRIPEARILGAPLKRVGLISFIVHGLHPYDIASLLDKQGVAVRAGSHCAQPAFTGFGVDMAVRVSPAFYNRVEEIDDFITALVKTIAMLKKWSPRA